MGTYEFQEHTADEKFVVTADNLEDAFATSVDAFYEIMIPKIKVEEKITKTITIEALRLRSLLYDFLNELVFVYDDEDLLLRNVKSLKITQDGEKYVLVAELSGDKHYNYEVEMEIKNMTYSDMEVITADGELGSGKTSLTVVVDI